MPDDEPMTDEYIALLALLAAPSAADAAAAASQGDEERARRDVYDECNRITKRLRTAGD